MKFISLLLLTSMSANVVQAQISQQNQSMQVAQVAWVLYKDFASAIRNLRAKNLKTRYPNTRLNMENDPLALRRHECLT